MRQRVVITGMGCISPLGNDLQTTWENIKDGVSGGGPITLYDPSGHKCRIAAEVKGFNPEDLFGPKEAKRMDRFTQFTLATSEEAIRHAGLDLQHEELERIGAVVGTGIGGLGTLFNQFQVYNNRGPNRVSPFLVPMMLPDSSGGIVAIHFGLRGPNMAIVTACAAGANAIGEATEMIRRGAADVMLAGGSEAAIVPIAIAGMAVMNAVTNRNDDPEHASRPFDLERDGFLMGEGAAILVLESLEHAKARRAPILAELSGYATTNDAYHITAPTENGLGAANCMRLALEDAHLDISEIDYINAHGTSTYLNDLSETRAIKNVFQDYAYKIPISSTKSMTGHLLGATGALEAAISVMALQDQILPPTINYEIPDPECDLDYVPNHYRKAAVGRIMSNSFGFGGHNASIVIQLYQNSHGPQPANLAPPV